MSASSMPKRVHGYMAAELQLRHALTPMLVNRQTSGPGVVVIRFRQISEAFAARA
jgi:hypothetical protein